MSHVLLQSFDVVLCAAARKPDRRFGGIIAAISGRFSGLRKIVLRFTSFRNSRPAAMKTAIAKFIKRHFVSREIANFRARTGVAIC
jgi:hypothetical protein